GLMILRRFGVTPGERKGKRASKRKGCRKGQGPLPPKDGVHFMRENPKTETAGRISWSHFTRTCGEKDSKSSANYWGCLMIQTRALVAGLQHQFWSSRQTRGNGCLLNSPNTLTVWWASPQSGR